MSSFYIEFMHICGNTPEYTKKVKISVEGFVEGGSVFLRTPWAAPLVVLVQYVPVQYISSLTRQYVYYIISYSILVDDYYFQFAFDVDV